MGVLREICDFQTLIVSLEREVCTIQINRPDANNTINNLLIDEFTSAIELCEESAKVVVIQGTPEVFCFGADFAAMSKSFKAGELLDSDQSPEPLYDLWHKLASSSFITVAHVRGKANAGGIGFVAACDLVLAEDNAIFSLSELLFGLMPACVLPFLIRKIGYAKANYLTLMTQPINAEQAKEWGLVDAHEANSSSLLRKHLLRLSRLNKNAVARYKKYMNQLDGSLKQNKPLALAANREVFTDSENIEKISRYISTGKFPWET